MTRRFALVLSLLLSLVLSAGAESVLNTARKHVTHLLARDVKDLPLTYADQFVLKPGHEFLNPRYGLAGEDAQERGATVSRSNYMNVFRSSAARRRKPDGAQIAAMVRLFDFKKMPSGNGTFSDAGTETVKTSKGERSFEVEKGDVIFKVSRRRGDAIVIQMRQFGGNWRVVAELFD